jgi:hypothetical protein
LPLTGQFLLNTIGVRPGNFSRHLCDLRHALRPAFTDHRQALSAIAQGHDRVAKLYWGMVKRKYRKPYDDIFCAES